jgi:hypothetical protein
LIAILLPSTNTLRLLMIRPTTYFCRNTKRLTIEHYCQGNQHDNRGKDDLIEIHIIDLLLTKLQISH